MRRAAGLVVTLAAVMCQPRISAACSPPPCSPGYFVPATNSTVPANLPALYLRSPWSYNNSGPGDPALFKLTTTADPTTPLPLIATRVQSSSSPSDWELVPTQPLVEGTSYTATDGNLCQPSFDSPPISMFSVGPAAPLPTQAGALTLAPTEISVLEVWTISGSCTSPVDAASARIQLDLSADALPWRDVLHFETLIDGQPWTNGNFDGSYRPPGSNGQGRGVDVVFRVCHADDPGVATGLGPGVHSVAMRATLPGTNVILMTAPISVALGCPPAPTGADVTDVSPEPAEQTGCGCATSSTSSIAPLLLALAAVAARTTPARRRPGPTPTTPSAAPAPREPDHAAREHAARERPAWTWDRRR